MSKFTLILFISITFLAGCSPALGDEGGYVEQEYLGGISLINPRHENVLDFLEDSHRMDFYTLALKAYEEGDYENAARFHLASLQDRQDENIMYFLACDYALMGEPELAVRALKYAVKAGFHHLDHIGKDPDFDGIRETDVFKEALAEITEYVEAQTDEEERRLYFEATAYSPGIAVLPDGYAPDNAYPVLIALHGGAHSAEKILELRDMFDDPDFIFVALQAQNPVIWEGKVGYNWIYRDTTDREVQLRAIEMTERYIMDAVAMIKDEYKTDGVYLAGFSEGGAMAYITGIKHPDSFEGIIPISGFMVEAALTDEIVAAGNALRVFAIHGSADASIPYERGTQAFERLIDSGYDAELYTHDGVHELNEEGIKKARAWMGL